MRRYQKKRMKRLEVQKNKTAGNPGADVRPAKDNRAAENILSGSTGAENIAAENTAEENMPADNTAAAGKGKRAALVSGIAVGILAAVYLGGALFFQFHFLPNTTINGRDFSGRSAGTLHSYLKERTAGYELAILGKTGSKDTIRGSDIALSYEGNAEAEGLMKKQNAFLWPGAFFTENVSGVETGVEYDTELLKEKLQTLKAVTEEQIEPVSAAPQFDGNQFVPGREQEGTAVDMESLAEAVRKSISGLEPELDLKEEGCYKAPKYTSDSPEVQAACDTMNQYCRAGVTYEMDEPVVVDKALISGWLTVDENMQVIFNTEAVKQWLAEFGRKYDTVGTTRTFTTADGLSAEVSGGTYGWEIDEEAELTALTADIENGVSVTRAPAYCENGTAAVHGPQDWGSTYVEVDLTRQHMWYVKDGTVMMETDVVTGKPTPDKETPQGVYSILEMKRDKVLLGDIKANGQREYETRVNYWMRVTWTGIGFHDATWQTAFGGERYKTAGSHGCINMSLSDAGRLYEMLEMYTPVVIHY